jgi:2-phosphosulfolactate phosphatase
VNRVRVSIIKKFRGSLTLTLKPRFIMKIDLAFTPHELEKKDLEGKSIVVIDALRATSTMIVAFENGASAFIPVATVEEARELVAKNPEFLLAGERRALPLEGFQLGNSPRDYKPDRVNGKTIVMTTTNGTRALVASRGGAEVFIGSFLNLQALCCRLTETGRDVLIACSGEKDFFCMEDTVCGGALIDRLEKTGFPTSKTDAASAAKVLYEQGECNVYEILCACEWGQYLEGLGLGRDVRICAQIDSSNLVPVYRKGKIFLDR